MALLSLQNVSLAFGGPALFEDVSLHVERGDRVGLLGRNGCGKSTLLRLIAGELKPDSGAVVCRQGVRIASLPQDVPADLTGTVYEEVLCGLGPVGQDLLRYHRLARLVRDGDESRLQALLESQQSLEASGGWPLEQLVGQVLSHLHLDGDVPVCDLSGGVKRRVLLARALVGEPDVLLLDEPTNHLDIDTIDWLESFLLRSSLTLLFVTHDREFLKALATRTVELDRGHLFDFACDYPTFLRRREETLHAEEQQWQRFDRKLAQEEVWIRQGIKARRTRNMGRVRELQRMREERLQRRNRTGKSRLQLQEASRSGKLVAELEGVCFGYGDKPVVKDLTTTIMRGDRVGIIGPNGVGKSTLLKLILGQLAPQQGQLRLGTNLEVLYFDQLREQLDPDATVQQNLSGDQDTVLVGGTPRHVYGYLQDFLFTPDRARTPVRILSGGERHRLLLAKLFTREANVLVLDEPTNDLDLETLELLEELLAEFSGTVLLVSHDRAFLDRVVTGTLVYEGEGRFVDYVGGYQDWLRQRPVPEPEPEPVAAKPAKPAKSKPERSRPRKLSFKERRELEGLPLRIEALETEQADLHEKLADPAFYKEQGDAVSAVRDRMTCLEEELAECFVRWEELEALAE
ncbi:DNA-binding ATPase Uup [Syntrophotalea carbinolica DSM 2380]|uniref:ATP-binding protein Uup n=1 Tax=Syntrophotalea carbinolica (strain DSM 2380 / NBRC 103641 / GraBd1) TaxID=338963 RepID=Q3A7F3_SYNC1|nr:ATP-binding cassette domain-containing protein [Syntrophotalea carbinolica]ABA87691.2 DNA-binding ATPase Uup [Syntrophotalea carbinolica DSM 2380]